MPNRVARFVLSDLPVDDTVSQKPVVHKVSGRRSAEISATSVAIGSMNGCGITFKASNDEACSRDTAVDH